MKSKLKLNSKSNCILYERATRFNFNCCASCEASSFPSICDEYCHDIPVLDGYVLTSCPKFVVRKSFENE